jgi:hypothetical protein
MKTKIIAIFASLLFAATVYATFISPPYDKSKTPRISLPIAYEYATAALGSDTNQFHCISASVTTTFSSEGEWYFTFCSTNSKVVTPKWIAVGFNGKVIFDHGDR